MQSRADWPLVLVIVAVAAVAVVIAFVRRDAIGPDGIALLALARHLRELRADLLISALWSPLVPTLTAAATACGVEERLAGHLVLAAAAPILSLWTFRLSQLVGLARPVSLVAAICVGASAASWAGALFTADVWGAALLLVCVCRLLETAPEMGWRTHAMTGVCFGVGALARHSTLPAAIGTMCLLALVGDWAVQPIAARLRAAVIISAAATLTLAPWITAVSLRRGTITYTTATWINHSCLNEDVPGRVHPSFSSLHVVEPGRLFEWEDPPTNRYTGWSPFASMRNARWQASLMRSALVTQAKFLSWFTIGGIGLACVAAALAHRLWNRRRSPRWTQLALPVGVVVAMYTPLFAGASRYTWPCYAFVVVCVAAVLTSLCQRVARLGEAHRIRLTATLLAVAAIATPVSPGFGLLRGLTTPARSWTPMERVADALHAAGVAGPIVCDGSAGMIVALSANAPFHGSAAVATREEVDAVGANVILLEPESRWLEWVSTDQDFARLRIGTLAAPDDTLLVFTRVR